jgi:hypothetical protein
LGPGGAAAAQVTPVWIDTDRRDKLAQKYIGQEKYPYLEPGEQRVIVKVRPEKTDSQGIE